MKMHWQDEARTTPKYGTALVELFEINPLNQRAQRGHFVFKRLQYLERECKGWNAWRDD